MPRNGRSTARSWSASLRKSTRSATSTSPKTKISKVLFVYGVEPSGHASAARALERAFQDFPGVSTQRLVLSSDIHPVLGPVFNGAYLQIIQRLPALWDFLYDNEPIAQAVQALRKFFLLLERGRLKQEIKALSPDVVVCTHALSLFSIACERESGHLNCRLAAVVTDFGIHTYWSRAKADLCLVPSAELGLGMQKVRYAGKVRATGIPINPIFEAPGDKRRARMRLGLAQETPVLLLSGGSKAIGPVLEMAEVILKQTPDAQLLVACGNNNRLLNSLRRRFAQAPGVHIYEQIPAEEMKELLCAADLFIGKAGGLTCAESLAVGLPLLFYRPIPGQEVKNSDYLIARQAAVKAGSIEELGETVRALIADSGRLKEMGVRAKALGRPGAARLGAEEILRLLG